MTYIGLLTLYVMLVLTLDNVFYTWIKRLLEVLFYRAVICLLTSKGLIFLVVYVSIYLCSVLYCCIFFQRNINAIVQAVADIFDFNISIPADCHFSCFGE